MTQAATHISRETAQRYGHETMTICKAGFYVAPSGSQVSLQPALDEAIQATRSYPPDVDVPVPGPGQHTNRIEVVNETTLSGARRLLALGFEPVVLNFASATHPGGGFLSGSRAQEEYLAWSTCLYPCLRDNPMYAFHRSHHNPLHTDYVLYSPGVPVIRGDDGRLLEVPYHVAILTSPAVEANRLSPESHDQALSNMHRRIRKVLAVGLLHGHRAIVLGAWGCGAFGNNPMDIAELFRRELDGEFRGTYQHIVFAILSFPPEERAIGPFRRAFEAQ